MHASGAQTALSDLTGSHGQSPGTKSHATSMSRTVSPSFAAGRSCVEISCESFAFLALGGVLRSRRVSVDLTQPVPNTEPRKDSVKLVLCCPMTHDLSPELVSRMVKSSTSWSDGA